MNKRIITLILALAAVCGGASAQPKNAYCPTPNHRGAGKMNVVDTTRIRVWYAFNADDVKKVNTYIDQQRLDIGKHLMKYYSDFLFCSDSVISNWSKTHPGARSVPRFHGNGGKDSDTWSEYEYSDIFISGGKLTEYATMPQWLESNNSYYTEPYPLQQWKMGAETQNILGHRCQKATCHWRGRDFVAWFAPDIPVKAGPWKLCGLPGLILEAEADGIHRFTIADIQRIASPIYYETNAITVKTTEEKLIKMRIKTFRNRLYLKNPKYYVGDLSTADVTHDTEGILVNNVYVNNKAHVFQPLEKE